MWMTQEKVTSQEHTLSKLKGTFYEDPAKHRF